MSIKHGKPNIQLTTATTLGDVSANYFVTLSYSWYTVTLPDVEVMCGESLTFVVTNSNYEGRCTLSGPIDVSDSSYALTAPGSVTLLSDGNRWWITSVFNY